MIPWQRKQFWTFALGLLMLLACGFAGAQARGQATATEEVAEEATEEAINDVAVESEGLAELDEAMRLKVTSTGLQDLNQVITKLEVAIDRGLEVDDNDFAEQMLSDSLMERASTLMQVINTRSIMDPRVQKIRALVTSDLRRVLDYDDPIPNAYLMLGKLMALPGGDPHEARRVIGKYLELEELPADEHAEALVLRAQLMKDDAKALADMQAAIELAPENMGYRLAKAVFLRRAKKLDEADAAIDEVIQLSPEDANAYILKGEIYREQNRLQDALASFDKATELEPEAPGPFQNRGEIYRQQGQYEEAIAQFNEVLKLQPGVLLTLMHRADAFLASEKLQEALTDIEIVLEKQPLVAAHRLRAAILIKMDRLDEAVKEMESVSAAMPDQPELKMQLALYYLVDKQSSKAISLYSDILEQDPDNFETLQARGDAYLNVGMHAEAIADFRHALKLQPEDTTLLNNLAWVLATSPEDSLRDGKQAVEFATKACELTDYKTPHILSTLAAAFAEEGNFETAIKWSQQAVDLKDPEHGEQLAKELDSYRDGQPWREKQTIDEKAAEKPPLVDTPQVDPHAEVSDQLKNQPPPKLELRSSDPIEFDLPIEN